LRSARRFTFLDEKTRFYGETRAGKNTSPLAVDLEAVAAPRRRRIQNDVK
jgi:hypothetical protein